MCRVRIECARDRLVGVNIGLTRRVLRLFAQYVAEVPGQRVEPNVLERQCVLVGHVQLAAPCGLSDVDPVGGLVADTALTRGLNEGLE